jgi:hypothetical protein
VEFHSVRPAVVLDDEIPRAFRIDAENSPEWRVDDEQVSVPIESRTFEKAFDFGVLTVGIGPAGAALFAELARHRREDFGFDELERFEWIEHA